METVDLIAELPVVQNLQDKTRRRSRGRDERRCRDPRFRIYPFRAGTRRPDLYTPLFKSMMDEAADRCRSEGFIANRYFLAHPDPNVSRLAANLISEKNIS